MANYDDDLRQDLKRYVNQELDKGYSLEEIKQVLLDIGHHPGEIRKATNSDYTNEFNAPIIATSTILYILLILLLSATTTDTVLEIIIGLLPLLGTIILVIIIAKKSSVKNRNLIWLVPFLLTVIFYMTAINNPQFIKGNLQGLVFVNLILGFGFTYFLLRIKSGK